MSIKTKKECREYIIDEKIIKQEEAIDYDVNYYRANYRRCEKIQEIDYIKYKPNPIVDFEIIKCKKIKKPIVYEIIDELIEKIESSELINNQKHECCEIIKDKKIEIIRHQKVEDINMLKSSRNESDKIKELGLTMKELKAIARKRGVKNYENLSRIRLVEEIDKLEPSEELKNQ